MKVAMPFLIGVAGWTFTNILDHEKRLVRIESTQPTSADIDAISDKLNDLKLDVATRSAGRDMQMNEMQTTLTKIREYLVARPGEGRLP